MFREMIAKENSSVVHVTEGPGRKDNIYCERSYCTPDSRWFVFQRDIEDCSEPVRLVEYVACEFGSWIQRVIGRGFSYPEISPSGFLYHSLPAPDGTRKLARIEIDTGVSESIPVNGGVRPISGMTVSRDETMLAYGVCLSRDPPLYAVEVVDLESGGRRIIYEDPWISNPHAQFDPGDSNRILVQKNRGPELMREFDDADSKDGATLIAVNVDTGTAIQLAVGPPYTRKGCTGHQQWIGKSGEVLLSTRNYRETEVGNLLAVRPGESARVVSRGYGFYHVNASVCGRMFCCDSGGSRIIVGSVATGENRVICFLEPADDESCKTYGQSAHLHPYLSPDLQWVVFNQCADGFPQVCVAGPYPSFSEFFPSWKRSYGGSAVAENAGER